MRIIGILAPVIALMLSAGLVYAGGSTAFNYQGRLLDAGEPANGLFDFEFSLWDGKGAGSTQIGATVVLNNVDVVDGLFTVLLDFGADAFDNADRWLEVTVNNVLLNPRQPVTRVPYAIQTRGIFVDQDQGVFVGRQDPVTPQEYFGVNAPVDGGFGGMYISTDGEGALPFYGYAAGGTFDAYHFYDGSTGSWHLNNNGNRLTVQSNGFVGIGTTAPEYALHVVSTASRTIFGLNTATSGVNYGVYGQSDSTTGGRGVRGNASASSGGSFGVHGSSSSSSGLGVAGIATANSGVNSGVYGFSQSPDGFAFFSDGDCHVAGTLSKSGGAFKIDHPLDPANKYLQHSFVESPDMMNVYNGNVILDENGKASIRLPDYFAGLNRDFRYQLTPMGAAMPNLHISQEIANNSFRIAGGKARMKVSWQVTGIRQDPWAEAHRIEVEPYKRPEHQGKYLHPELYGQPNEMAVHYFPEAEHLLTETALAKAQAGQTANRSTGGTK